MVWLKNMSNDNCKICGWDTLFFEKVTVSLGYIDRKYGYSRSFDVDALINHCGMCNQKYFSKETIKSFGAKKGGRIAYEEYRRVITFKDRSHTLESKQKISEKAKERLRDPTKNSQYGTCWITNGQENQKIKKELLDIWIEKGYYKGRTKLCKFD